MSKIIQILTISAIKLLALPQLGWCQNLCQLNFTTKESSAQTIAQELRDLHRSMRANLNTPLAPVLKKQFEQKLEQANKLLGPKFDLQSLLVSKESLVEDHTPPPPVHKPERVLNPYFESESYAPKLNERIPPSSATGKSIVRPIPLSLPLLNFEFRASESALKLIKEYFFLTEDKVFAVEPVTKMKVFFGPIDNLTTGAVSPNQRWAVLVHHERIYLWDLQQQISKTLKFQEAVRMMEPRAEYGLKKLGAIHVEISNSGRWLINNYYGLLIDMHTGEIRQVRPHNAWDPINLYVYSFAKNSDTLYIADSNGIARMDLAQGIHASEVLISQMPTLNGQPKSKIEAMEIHPLETLIAFTRLDNRNIHILETHSGKLVQKLSPTAQQDSLSLVKFKWSEDGNYLVSVGNQLVGLQNYRTEFMLFDPSQLHNINYFAVDHFHDVILQQVNSKGFTATGKFKNTTQTKRFRLE